MEDPSTEVDLPFEVEKMLQNIRVQQLRPPPDFFARRSLSKIGELAALQILTKIASVSTRIQNLDAYIVQMVKNYCPVPYQESIYLSPEKRSSSCFTSDSPRKNASYDSPIRNQFIRPCSSLKGASAGSITPQFDSPTPNHSERTLVRSVGAENASYDSPIPKKFISDCSSSKGVSAGCITRQLFESPTPKHPERTSSTVISQQSRVLAELEFRKYFMIQSYIGGNKLEDVVSVEDAFDIIKMKQDPMLDFESRIWSNFGSKYCQPADRTMYIDWDSGKTHLYYCFVKPDGSYYFKGPYLDTKRTHLQRTIGDDNVLIVKFADVIDVSNMASSSCNSSTAYDKIFEAGILVGLRCYRLFVFKDGGKEEEKKKGKEDKKTPNSRAVKCFFVRRESLVPWDERDPYVLSQKTVHGARCLFMHLHTVSSMAEYIARFSLILSQTIKLQVDLASVVIETIEDIPCRDENGCDVYDKCGEQLIHTDGTGFISEDLALLCPKDFVDAKFIKDEHFERLREREACISEPPLLIQCRLFNKGCAVKGTLLVNKKLKCRTILIRRSMVKVKTDSKLSDTESFNSLELVAISHKPRKANLSRNLIALLSIGGVPKEYFLGLLERALEDARRVCSNKRAAARVAQNYGKIDDCSTSFRMIMAGVPLNEPYLQHRLSHLAREERKGLGGGKLPVSESFYLMGTADPTGVLNSDEVCVILDNGQISGKVLVYRNPGLHFGDVHVLNAIYVKSLEDFVGNAKYGIFFSTKGRRSAASEIANGDFDGDMYWVSRNPQLLSYFKASEPWERIHSAPNASNKKPSDFSHEELEHELFKLLLDTRKQSNVAGIASDSWLALMDQLLILGDDNENEKRRIKEKMLVLIDIYYDALDASKSGKKVEIPEHLRAEQLPHYLERGRKTYQSTSVLGQIYDKVAVDTGPTENLSIEEIWELPCFNVEIPEACLKSWKERYDTYRDEMKKALGFGDESKNDSANSVIKKYKQMLYGGKEFEESTRNIDDIYNEALAIYHVTYRYAWIHRDVKKCGFAWRVAGSALCHFHCTRQEERSIPCLASVLREVIN